MTCSWDTSTETSQILLSMRKSYMVWNQYCLK